MKKGRFFAFMLSLSMILVACGTSSSNDIEGGNEETVAHVESRALVPVETQQAPETDTTDMVAPEVKFDSLEITLDELVEIINPAQEVSEFYTYNTPNFTISKVGSSSAGVVCFTAPEQSKLSAIYFLSYAGASSQAYHRKAAIESQKLVMQYCEENNIGFVASEDKIESTLVFSVFAKDSPLLEDELPISLSGFRSPKEFFASEERKDTYKSILLQCDYPALAEYLNDFVQNNEIEENDVIFELLENANRISSVAESCIINFDQVEGNAIITYPKANDIDREICLAPVLYSNSVTGVSLECKVGFVKSGWLFFDSITIIEGEEKDTSKFKSYDITRDVLNGSTVTEFIYTSAFNSILLEVATAHSGAIRFLNSDSREIYDHTFNENELSAVETLYKIYQIHSTLYYALNRWESM